ncbi:gephyrin-like molybdotransferase Glp [Deinococcus lacus]|uniref:Molybdopterin molybdenumtransferase n=1 Tax=Deinococcus lacus TaxID=392561 RepID=A0ABW1YCZ6_9DEIO
MSHPSAPVSALDGVACRQVDTLAATHEQPVRLRLAGESRAGSPGWEPLGPGECARIYTGAPLPPGADAICPVEQLGSGAPEGWVDLLRPARPEDVRPLGEDFGAGEMVLPPGRLTPERLALAAALGHAAVPVLRPWRVALLSTGDEVKEPGEPLLPGEVYDSNRVGLRALLSECGCGVLDLGHAPDHPGALAERLESLGGADLLLTSGGVSMGRYDFVRDLLLERGKVDFWKVRMRPGGPVMLGTWADTPVLALPGNPVSSLVVFQVLARPALTGEGLHRVWLRAGSRFSSLPDKTLFVRATCTGGTVQPYPRQSSGVLRSLSESQALAVIPEGQDKAPGDEVEVLLL